MEVAESCPTCWERACLPSCCEFNAQQVTSAANPPTHPPTHTHHNHNHHDDDDNTCTCTSPRAPRPPGRTVEVERARELLGTDLTALVGESYERAYTSMVQGQQLVEMEEIIACKLVQEAAVNGGCRGPCVVWRVLCGAGGAGRRGWVVGEAAGLAG